MVPVRGRPVTKMGRSMGTSACCGYCFHAASDSRPGHQCVADEEPRHLAAELGQIGVARIGLEKHAECFAIVVVVTAEIVEAHRFGGRRVQFVDGADVGSGRHQALYSPQLTSRVWPVMPLDRSLAMNRIADATSSSVGSRLRSEFAAVAW